MARKNVLIMGAAGRDFHNFNVFFRKNRHYNVVAFTATQIPDIDGRVYPKQLAGKLYPKGIKIYDEKNGNLVQFLKGNSAAIVDTDPGQVAIMKANLDGFVKDLTGDQLQALSAYMRSK